MIGISIKYKLLHPYRRTCRPSNGSGIHWDSDQWHCHKEHYLYNVHMACCNLFHRNIHCILELVCIFTISYLFTHDIKYKEDQRVDIAHLSNIDINLIMQITTLIKLWININFLCWFNSYFMQDFDNSKLTTTKM